MKQTASLERLVARAGEQEDGDPFTYIAALRRYFRRRAAEADIDDLVQDVFVSLQARRSADPIKNIGGYLFAIAGHVLAQHQKQYAQRRVYANSLSDNDVVATDVLSPEHMLICKSDLETAVGILKGLPERTAQIFILHRFESFTYSALADRFGISVSGVEKHMMRALSALEKGLTRTK